MNVITRRGQPIEKEMNYRGTTTEKRYYAWWHESGTCCVTGQPFIEVAHTGKKHMSLKAPLWTCLGLIEPLHVYEEKNRKLFWRTVGLPDHLDWAKKLWDCFLAWEYPDAILAEMQGRVDRDYVRSILGEIDY